VRPAIAVLLSRFPLVTETFILREVEELERQGQPVWLVPLVREHPAVVHREAQPWIPRALFTPYLSPAILAANARAFARRPYRYVRLFGRLLLGCLRSLNVLARTVALFPKCVYLAERLEREGIQHVHAHYATHPATAALIISSLAPISFSFTAHAHDIFVAWRRPLLGLKVRRARFIRVISAFNQTFLRALYPESAGKLRVIHVGIEPDRYRPVPSSFSPGHAPSAARHGGNGAGVPRVLCVAALQPYKGIAVLIEACGRLQATRARFLCEVVGDGRLRGALAEQIARARLGDCVRLRGALRQDEVAALLRHSAMVVLPSVVARDGQMEGIPVALMEAMAAELPVIAPAISGVPELIDHGVNGLLVEPGNPDALADAIAALLADPARRRELGRRGREKVLRAFRLDACAAALLRDLDQWNPPPAPTEGLLDLAARAGFTGHHLGVRRVHGGRDSTVIELLAADGRRGHELILKAHRSRPGESRAAAARAKHEYDVLAWLEPRFSPGNAGGSGIALQAPRPLAMRTSDASVVMERCGGARLDDLIRGARRDPDGETWRSLERAVEGAGRWVHRLQQVTRRAAPEAAHRAWNALVDGALGDLAACPGRTVSPRIAGLVRRRLEELRQRPPRGTDSVGCHGDLSPGNIFVAPASVAVVDFEGFHEGLPWEDIAYFLVHLELYFAPPRRAARFGRLQEVFLGASGVAPDPVALELGRAVAALKALARMRAPSWRTWFHVHLLWRAALGRGRR
jgi:glycosyltransferase involved in cell wall biosynthesis/aminoglycoside phosphotransferase (APT) family kinase protein